MREAADKEREITYKGATDLVTDTDQKSETTLLGVRSRLGPPPQKTSTLGQALLAF